MRTTGMALLLWMAGAAAHGREIQQRLTVYVQVGTTDRLILLPLAQELAGKIFSKIGVQVEWKSGKRPGEFQQSAIAIEAVPGTRDFKPEALGYAQYQDTRITVFLDRVERFECPATVLAHVLVHEITHIVEDISRHSETGVMKARWTGHDYSEMRHRPLPFAPEDLELIYDGMSRRGMAAAALSSNAR